MKECVAILGAGVAGLTAAHELGERGFDVVVYERRDVAGGKARSMDGPTAHDGFAFPAEHGFRFFPGFYRHVFDTMRRIPYGDGPRGTVRRNLRWARKIQLLLEDAEPIVATTYVWRWCGALTLQVLRRIGQPNFVVRTVGLDLDDIWFLLQKLWVLLKACRERRFAEYEGKDWWGFSGAEQRVESLRYARMMRSFTRTLVAARAQELSVRTAGYIFLQLQFGAVSLLRRPPRVLDGPTSEVWIEPWREHLTRAYGVRFEFDTEVEELHCQDGRITEVVASRAGQRLEITADWYVAALPVEVMKRLVTPAIARAEPGLANLSQLRLRWMNGVMFYLRRNEDMVRHGLTVYVDSPWALTSVSQLQFWQPGIIKSIQQHGAGGILSVDVSDWYTRGVLYGKPAMNCTEEEVKREVLEQLRLHVKGTPMERSLDDENIVASFLDPAIMQPNPAEAPVNLEPLLINATDSWQYRPHAVTGIQNLFLASDYVRTYTDLPCMEAANEAARRAVNGILDASGSAARRCPLWPLTDAGAFSLARRLDRRALRRFDREAFDRGAALLRDLEVLDPRRNRGSRFISAR